MSHRRKNCEADLVELSDPFHCPRTPGKENYSATNPVDVVLFSRTIGKVRTTITIDDINNPISELLPTFVRV
jgi:hypothetical protein